MEMVSDLRRQKQAHYLIRSMKQAIHAFRLLEDGDHVAVALSGGKDSLVLLDLLMQYRPEAQQKYEVAAIHVDAAHLGYHDVKAYLREHSERLGVSLSVVPLEITSQESLPLGCYRCSRLRRKALFQAAAALGCNKIALGHHADDSAETILLSLLYKSRLEALLPQANYFDAFALIRPLILTPEKRLRAYARTCGYESHMAACGERGEQSRRVRVRAFLRGFGRDQRQVRRNLWNLARQEMASSPLCPVYLDRERL